MFAVVPMNTKTDFYHKNTGFDFVKDIKTEMLKLSYKIKKYKKINTHNTQLDTEMSPLCDNKNIFIHSFIHSFISFSETLYLPQKVVI